MVFATLNKALGSKTRIIGSELETNHAGAGDDKAWGSNARLVITLANHEWKNEPVERWKEGQSIYNASKALAIKGIALKFSAPEGHATEKMKLELTGPKNALEDVHAAIIARDRKRPEGRMLETVNTKTGFTPEEYAKAGEYLDNYRKFGEYLEKKENGERKEPTA